MISLKKQLVLAATTVLLAACGGGGGGSTDSKPASNSLSDPQVQASISAAVSNGFNWEAAPSATTVTVQGAAGADLRVNVSRYTEEILEAGQAAITLRGESLGSGTTDAAGKVDLAALNLPAGSSDMVLVEVFDDQRPELGALAFSKVRADQVAGLVLQLKG
jgi:hypothetical protein